MYLNARERGLFIALLTVMPNSEKLMESKMLSDEHKDYLKTAYEAIKRLSSCLFAECGKSFERAVKNEVQNNELVLIPDKSKVVENAKKKAMLTSATAEVMTELNAIRCFECQKKNFRNCKYFQVFEFWGKDGETKGSECPYK